MPAVTTWVGRKVKVTYAKPGASAEKMMEGVVVAYNTDTAMLLTRAKQSYPDLIESTWIKQITEVIDIPKLTVSTVRPVEYYDVRRHLLNMHGYTLTEVNSISDTDAMAVHAEIHKQNPDLGHTHTS